jgi:hypothetical protein
MAAVVTEAQFDAMAREWRELGDRAARAIGDWEASFERIAAEQARLRADGLWTHGRDDMLGVLRLHRDEVRHSRLIAWLLDPCAHHGLGSRVLDGLLARLFPGEAFASLADAHPRCEVPLLEGRLDIVVDAPGLHLVIENKVDAPEGPGQCDYYYEHVDRPDARFVLLSPDGRRARSEDAEVRDAFRPLRYADLAGIIRGALASSAPRARGRVVVEEYLRTLEKEFGQ